MDTGNVGSSYFDLARLGELKARADKAPEEAVMEVARQFESIFVNMMLSSARDTLQDGGLFESPALENYQKMFDQQVSMSMSDRAGGIGLAEMIARQLTLGTGGSGRG